MRIFVTTRQSPNFIYSKYIEKFASKYKLYLPTKEELKAEIETQKAMLVALAMIFSYVESLIPINFGIPGMKLGVANLVTVTGMYFLEFPEVFLVVVMRILLTGFLFGNGMSIVYSLAGGILSFLVMALMKRLKGFSVAGVSIAGGVSHNIGQIIVASVVVENLKLIYYLPALLIAGTVTGFVMGMISKKLLPIVKRESEREAQIG